MQEEPSASRPGTWTAQRPHQWSKGQRTAAIGAAALLIGAGLWTLHSFLHGLGWGAIFATSLWPMHQRCCQRWPGGRRLLLPLAFTLFILLVFVIPLVMVVTALVHDSSSVLQWLAAARAQGVPAPDFLYALPHGDQLVAWWQSALGTPEGISRLSMHAQGQGGFQLVTGERIVGGLTHRILLVSFMLLTLFFLLRDGDNVTQALRIATRRAFGSAGENVARQAVQAIRGTVNGLVIVGFGEGFILGLTYMLAGVTHPALLGLLTALLSAIPMGAVVAVVVAVGMQVAAGHMAAAIVVAAVGGAVIFVADHFVRPVFIGGATRLPFLWVLLGILGGIEAWGLIGLVLGPALMAVLMLLWREFVGAVKGPLNPAATDSE
ncbi:MAG: AI-2E family transporter [Sphingomonadales bacterium]|nr:AI-2E family transporter [Sphingomonadales bacterium]MDE2171848.1 AI-2E family transporter [Sphingomonadales bacterium]